MAEFKKLSTVETVEAVSETAHVLIEENGIIKKAAKSEIGAQADWAEMDENSPAFIKNKPEISSNPPSNAGIGFGFDIVIFSNEENASVIHGDYFDIKNKLKNRLPVLCAIVVYDDVNDDPIQQFMEFAQYLSYSVGNDNYIAFYNQGADIEYKLYSDNHIVINYIG